MEKSKNPWSDKRRVANGESVQTNFKNWFGDSVFVNGSGEPLILYHGTSYDFSSFSKKGVAVNFRNAQKELGFFLTDNAQYAEKYAFKGTHDESINRPLIMPVYVSMKNPVILPQSLLDEIEDGKAPDQPKWKVQRARDFIEDLKSKGHDGIVFDISWKQGWEPKTIQLREIVAFDSTQIKSALGNSGLYLKDSLCLTDQQVALSLQAAIRAARFLENEKGSIHVKP